MWYLLPLLAGVLIAFSELSSKIVANHNLSTEMKCLIANIIGAVCALLFIPFEKIQLTANILPLCILVINGAIMAVGYLVYFSSFKHVNLSVATLLSKTSVVVYTLGGIILFKEILTPQRWVGAILIIASLLLISGISGLKKITFDKWTSGILLAGILFGISILMDNYLSAFFSPFMYLFFMFTITAVLLYIYFVLIRKSVVILPDRTLLAATFLASLFSVGGQALILTAYRIGGYVSLSNLIGLVRIPLVVLIGIVFMKEKDNISRKLVAMVILIAGLILLKL